jgi:hypothetical protein
MNISIACSTALIERRNYKVESRKEEVEGARQPEPRFALCALLFALRPSLPRAPRNCMASVSDAFYFKQAAGTAASTLISGHWSFARPCPPFSYPDCAAAPARAQSAIRNSSAPAPHPNASTSQPFNSSTSVPSSPPSANPQFPRAPLNASTAQPLNFSLPAPGYASSRRLTLRKTATPLTSEG